MENKKILKAEINGKEIIGKTNKELVFNSLQEIYNLYKDLPMEERINAYINYFVDTFSYDDDLATKTLDKNRKPTKELNENELVELFINNAGVCNQFAQALSMLSCFDKEINIHYCYCRVIGEGDAEDKGHAVNLATINKKAYIVDISSMIHAKEGKYKQGRESFSFIDFKTYVEKLKNENIDYTQISNNQYVLGSITYFEDFDTNYLVLTSTSSELNQYGFNNNIWKIPTFEEENEINP